MYATRHFIRTRLKPRSIDEEARTLIAVSYLNDPEITIDELRSLLLQHEIRLTRIAVSYLRNQFRDNLRFLVKPALVDRLASSPARKVSTKPRRIVSAQRLSAPRRAVLHVLTESNHPLGPNAIAARTGMRSNNVRFLLYQMSRAGEVVRVTHGRYRPAPPEHPGRRHTPEPGPGRWGHG